MRLPPPCKSPTSLEITSSLSEPGRQGDEVPAAWRHLEIWITTEVIHRLQQLQALRFQQLIKNPAIGHLVESSSGS